MGDEDVQPLEILDVENEGEDEGVMTFESIYGILLEKDDIILTIDNAALEDLKRGMSVVKQNHSKRMQKAGNKADERTLKFKVLEEIPETEPVQIRLQIWLAKKGGVRVHKMIFSDKDL